METNVRYTIVGAFVLLLFAAIVLGVIWLSSGLSIETYDIYQVNMKESVSGLTVDAAVEFNGVNVGTVKSIQIDETNPDLVKLLLRIRSNTPITEGTRATMNMRGLTGVTFIALQDKGNNEKPLVALEGQEYPVIQTTPSLLMRFDIALTKLNESLHSVSVSVENLLSKENIQLFNDIMVNLRKVTDDVSPLLQNSMTTIEVFNRQTLPATNQAIITMDKILTNVLSITSEMKDNPSVLIRGKEPRPLGPGEK
ncbi:MAG TPA: MlaD family protein [Gammaproteobacteria bacterium]|jgi:phospholipid/cholesterol/gamma-HCH transport system substrate-binding protein|nr:MlaD family protein [Gammaproteobacteria bacterium]